MNYYVTKYEVTRIKNSVTNCWTSGEMYGIKNETSVMYCSKKLWSKMTCTGKSHITYPVSTCCINKSANALALCHPPSASFCSVLAGQWSSRIFTHDRYNILSDILTEFEVNLGIIIENMLKPEVFPICKFAKFTKNRSNQNEL